METENNKKEISELFGPDPVAAYELGRGAVLVTGRNRKLGALLTSERVVFYVQILYRMLLFKRAHELEPLYEDIFQAVRPAQEAYSGGKYAIQQFYADMKQLADWNLVGFRIEKERLRGYRDNRKRKFRYILSEECASLIEWLENRLLNDLEDRGHDTRDLLQEVCGSLNELLRLLHHLKKNGLEQVDHARRVLFQLYKTDDLTRTITVNLTEFNARLLHFIIQQYDIQEIRLILTELDNYVHSFLNQVFTLRREIVPLLDRLLQEANQQKIELSHRIMDAERLRTPHLLQSGYGAVRQGTAAGLRDFYVEDGKLDLLHRRISDSVIKLWQKLRSHLRELERKNNRLQDLRSRINEIVNLPEDSAPLVFLEKLLAPAHMHGDLYYWDEFQKADPPEPRKQVSKQAGFIKNYLRPKVHGGGKPVQTMDETRLAALDKWLRAKVLPENARKARVSTLHPTSPDDFAKVMELAISGYLDSGRRLSRIYYRLDNEEENVSLTLSQPDQRLLFHDMRVVKDR
ncbi:MAG: DUF2397 family protein [Thermodesulfobacteriota bacterium]|nr:DUF2397 family protein [Thermodesulfobacteriota bacterium]